MDTYLERLPLHELLGRHVVHDPRSRSHPVRTLVPRAARRAVLWRPRNRPLDQGGPLRHRGVAYGGLGACTGMAAAKALSCASLGPDGSPLPGRRLTEATALHLYSRATSIDVWDGAWPDTDTGSSGLAVAKAAVERGLASRYEHAFGIEQALDALQVGPLITGTLWLDGMWRTDPSGLLRAAGSPIGGHEWVVNGHDPATGEVRGLQSWGPAWGDRGTFRMSVADWASLLERDGDATRLVPTA